VPKSVEHYQDKNKIPKLSKMFCVVKGDANFTERTGGFWTVTKEAG
jgi:hypothetical protein